MPATNPDAVDNAAKPWWQSRTIIGIAILVLPRVLHRAGIDIAADDPALASLVTDLLDAVGGALALYGRIKAHRPLAMARAEAPASVVLLLILCGLMLGCTMVREGQRTVFFTTSNIDGLHFRSAAGTTLDAGKVDNEGVYTGATKLVMGAGGAAMAGAMAGGIAK